METTTGIVIKANNIEKFLNATDEQVAVALERCGAQAETYAKELCPSVTGALRNSITHSVNENTAKIGTSMHYAVYVEYGTGIYASEGGGRKTPWVYQDNNGDWHRTKGMKPKPFMKPAVVDHEDDYATIIQDELMR